MEVKDFSEKMKKVAMTKIGERTISPFVSVFTAASTFLGSSFSFPPLENIGKPLYHLSGAVSNLAFSATLQYSERQFNKIKDNPRCEEYGLEAAFDEQQYVSDDLSDREEERKTYKRQNIFIIASNFVVSSLLPPFGHADIPFIPFIYQETKRRNEMANNYLEIGDEIKEMINSDKSWREIDNYLDSFINKTTEQ
jgi:hypothetical protein